MALWPLRPLTSSSLSSNSSSHSSSPPPSSSSSWCSYRRLSISLLLVLLFAALVTVVSSDSSNTGYRYSSSSSSSSPGNDAGRLDSFKSQGRRDRVRDPPLPARRDSDSGSSSRRSSFPYQTTRRDGGSYTPSRRDSDTYSSSWRGRGASRRDIDSSSSSRRNRKAYVTPAQPSYRSRKSNRRRTTSTTTNTTPYNSYNSGKNPYYQRLAANKDKHAPTRRRASRSGGRGYSRSSSRQSDLAADVERVPIRSRSRSFNPRRSLPGRNADNTDSSFGSSQSDGYDNNNNNNNHNAARGSSFSSSRSGGVSSRSNPSRPSSSSSRGSSSSSRLPSSSSSFSHRRKASRSSRPNIVVIMTDDQDVLLGSLKAMPKLAQYMTRHGVTFNNSFVSTPMCCPSRSTFLTGLYVHNHNVYTNNDNCSSLQWRRDYESRAFPTYINHTHITGYFGKYLNEYNGSHTPAGWSRWVGLIKNSRFYNYSVINERGVVTRHKDNYYKDYLTDLVANDSCSFLQESKKRYPDKPVMMMLSLPAPHGPEDAAPQYQHMFDNNTDHRTPAWNHAPNPDKQWLLENMQKMIPQHKLFTDLLQRRRLQTLQSVDDVVEKVVDQLDMLGELDNTYIIYTSDHGYHLGQYGNIKGKGLPYDMDVRVPLIIRGPGIAPGSKISNIVHNIDLAPTLIDMAGGSVPDHMDGQSFFKVIKAARDVKNIDDQGFVATKKPWRDTVLLERGKLTERAMRKRMQTEEHIIYSSYLDKRMLYYIPPKKRRLTLECSKQSYRLPCKPKQKWYCIENNGRLKKHKCRNNRASGSNGSGMTIQGDQPFVTTPCECPPRHGSRRSGKEKRRKRRFRKRQAKRDIRRRYRRRKRSIQDGMINYGSASTSQNSAVVSSDAASVGDGSFGGFGGLSNRRCRILSNQSVVCDLDIYKKAREWESHKERIDDMIKEYRKALDDLRDIRRHLRQQKPPEGSDQDPAVTDDSNQQGLKPNAKKLCMCDETGRVVSEPKRRRRPKPDRGNKKKKTRKRRKKKNKTCSNTNMSCFTHTNDHWKTPPYWQYGPFCFCSNANNNTYWCLRTINQTHDFLYCEFITTFISFYDLKTDPFQLKNIVTELNYGILQQLHETLKKLKHCKGAKECMLRSGQKNRLPHDPQWAGLINLKRSKPGKRPYKDIEYPEDENGNSSREDGRRRYTNRHHKERRKQPFIDAPDYE